MSFRPPVTNWPVDAPPATRADGPVAGATEVTLTRPERPILLDWLLLAIPCGRVLIGLDAA